MLAHVIACCCRLKAEVVSQDEREETGLRAVLNYGHTFGHALETLSGYGTLLHGEAVAIGMTCAARLAERLGRVDAAFTARQRRLLEAFGLPVALPALDRGQDSGRHAARQEGAARPAAVGVARSAGARRTGRGVGAADVRAALERERIGDASL